MKLSFCGADREVTGSCHLLEVCGKRIVVDCGLEQGNDEKDTASLPFAANMIDYCVVTHAHIDHTGRLPLLAKDGFRGQVFATDSTCDLCSIMLRDSAHIQEFEAEWRNRKGKRSGNNTFEPLYTMRDAESIIKKLVPCRYEEIIELCPGVKIRFRDVGHLLGSASVEFWVSENGAEKKIVFSGDIGNINQPLIKDPSYVDSADYVVMESTYGDRSHNAPPDYAFELSKVIQRTLDRGGNVIIPSFAVGRTQEILYFIRHIKEENMVQGHGDFPVWVDSPLAVEATTIFNENRQDFDEEATNLIQHGINPISFSSLHLSVTSDESKLINDDPSPKVIISASGMCDAGRIKHHLKHNLWRSESSIVFVGFQAVGSLGRILLDGAKRVKMFGEDIAVHAEIVRLEGISGHADREGLLRWLGAISPLPQRVFIVHGESSVCDEFAAAIREEFGADVTVPLFGECFDLETGRQLAAGIDRAAERKKKIKSGANESKVFRRLLASGKRLLSVIEHNRGGTNKDLAKFADQIDMLSSKWDR